ncbi:hypothetical protein [Pannonibacter sp. P2PFMT1]|uniref:hypothetical protein n=1 Tax=Pannonibacter sp. P2PFMT1 TaxID=2003582 RepID=UPI001648CF0D|nr:hypothetical protein [Pannonibacter sp. P2PFMT1]
MDVVNFNEAEIARPSDITDIGENARDAFDAFVGGALGWPAHWARLTVAQKAGSSDIVTVSTGEYYDDDKVYSSRDVIEVNLQTFKPVLNTEERWVALYLVGTEETVNASRPVETSEEPLTESIPVNQSLPKVTQRRFSVSVQVGASVVPPAAKPAVPEGVCAIAFVKLTTTGIQAIESNQAARVKTVAEINGRLEIVETAIEVLVKTTQTIITDLAAVAQLARNAPSRALVSQLTNDVARTRQLLQFPDAARNYYFDNGLLPGFWDFTHADSLFRIKEGIRFQYANQRENLMRLLNADDPAVSVYGGTYVFPAHTEVTRIESPVGSVRQDIANVVHTVTTAVQHTVAYERIDFGPTIQVCENMAGWENIGSAVRAQQTFAKDGQEFTAVLNDNPWNADPASAGHQNFTANQIIRTSYSETYTTYNTEQFGLSGATYGQTFLNAQAMILTSIDLNFTRIGTTGDVLLCLCEVNAIGSPNFEAVLAKVNKPHADLALGWVNFRLPPTELKPGRRYAWFTVTTGNHQLAGNSGNAFAGGSRFVCTDGIWAQASTTEDFAFRVNGAKFSRSRTVVQLQSVTLDGGMTEMAMIYKRIAPAGTTLSFEVKASGATEWTPIDGRDPSPIANLPPLVQIRMVMQGTEDIAPGVVLDNDARIVTGRMQNIQRAVSKNLIFGFTTETVEVLLNMDAYDTARHNAVPKLLVGASIVEPDTISETVDPSKPTRTLVRAVFDFTGAAIASCRLRIDSSTDSISVVPFGQDVQLNAY